MQEENDNKNENKKISKPAVKKNLFDLDQLKNNQPSKTQLKLNALYKFQMFIFTDFQIIKCSNLRPKECK